MCFVRWARSHCVDSIILSLGGATVTVTLRNVCARTFDTRDTRVCDCSRSQRCRRLSACVCMCDNMLDSRSAARAWIMTPTRCASPVAMTGCSHTRSRRQHHLHISISKECARAHNTLKISWPARPGDMIMRISIVLQVCRRKPARTHNGRDHPIKCMLLVPVRIGANGNVHKFGLVRIRNIPKN